MAFNLFEKKIRQFFFFFLIFVISFTLSAISYGQTEKGKITVQVKGFENNNGKARLLIFSTKNKEYFPSNQNKAYGKYVVPIVNNKVTFTFENLPYGDYAISVHHDADNNGKVNTNFFGIPNEGLGASKDARGNFGPPSFDDAKITLKKEQMTIVINMYN